MSHIGIAQQGKQRIDDVHNRDGAAGSSSISRGIRHGVIQEISSGRIDVHRTGDRDRRSDVSVPHIMGLDAGFRPGLARLVVDEGSPQQFQFGIRRVRLDCLESNTEAHDVETVAGGR